MPCLCNGAMATALQALYGRLTGHLSGLVSCQTQLDLATRSMVFSYSGLDAFLVYEWLSTVPRNALPRWGLLISSGLSSPGPI